MDDSYGFKFVNLTVHPEPRVNQAPTAIIFPKQDVVKVGPGGDVLYMYCHVLFVWGVGFFWHTCGVWSDCT